MCSHELPEGVADVIPLRKRASPADETAHATIRSDSVNDCSEMSTIFVCPISSHGPFVLSLAFRYHRRRLTKSVIDFLAW